jgi:hypothetical protein
VGKDRGCEGPAREWLEALKKKLAKARERRTVSTWSLSWTIADVQARLGDTAAAREAIAEAGDLPSVSTTTETVIEVPVLVRMGDWDQAADLIRKREPRSSYDVCGSVDLAPIQRNPRLSIFFEKCANLKRPVLGV